MTHVFWFLLYVLYGKKSDFYDNMKKKKKNSVHAGIMDERSMACNRLVVRLYRGNESR